LLSPERTGVVNVLFLWEGSSKASFPFSFPQKGKRTMGTTQAPEPVRITVSAAADENLLLRALLRQAVPMLLHPEAFRQPERCGLVRDIAMLLDDAGLLETEAGSEPGSLSEREDPW
jgi:hypothetical protein